MQYEDTILLTLLLILINITKNMIRIPKSNKFRHLYANNKYGHYSNITSVDPVKFPKLAQCTVIKHKIEKCQYVYIPRGWWYWIRSTGRLINLFYQAPSIDIDEVPIVSTTDSILHNKWTDTYLSHKIHHVKVWDTNRDVIQQRTFSQFTMENIPGRIVTSLSAYGSNTHIIDSLETDIVVPDKLRNTKFDTRIIISYADMDFGLCYDDVDNLIHIVDGNVVIMMYPPSDIEYIDPMPLYPQWAIRLPDINISYNFYKQIPWSIPIKPNSYTNSRLLFKCIKSNRRITNLLDNLYEAYGPNKIVYAVNNYRDKHMTFDIYFYQLDKNPANIARYENFDLVQLKKILDNSGIECVIRPDDRYVAVSIHYDNKRRVESRYYKLKSVSTDLPIKLKIYDHTNNKIGTKLFEYKSKLEYKGPDYSDNPGVMTISSFKNRLSIGWLYIGYDQFLKFITDTKWHQSLLNFWTKNKQNVEHLTNDIVIHFNNEGQMIGSGFYGIL